MPFAAAALRLARFLVATVRGSVVVDAGRAQVNVKADCGRARTISLGFDLGAWGVFGGPVGVCEGGVTGAGVVVAGAGVGGGRAVGWGSGGR